MPNDSTRTVLVAMGADLGVALAALALNQVTGSSTYQAVAAVLIALVLIRLSLRLIQRSHDFLVGTWTGAAGGPQGRDVAGVTQPLRPAEVAKARAFLLGYPGVTAIRQLLVTFVGPGRIWIVARVDIDDGLRGAQVKSLVRGIESGMKQRAAPASHLRRSTGRTGPARHQGGFSRALNSVHTTEAMIPDRRNGSDMSVVVIATAFPVPGHRAEVIVAFEAAITRVHDEPGVELYALHEGPDRLVMIEKYESEQARSEHRKGVALADLRSALEGKLSSDLDAQVLVPHPAGNAQKGAL